MQYQIIKQFKLPPVELHNAGTAIRLILAHCSGHLKLMWRVSCKAYRDRPRDPIDFFPEQQNEITAILSLNRDGYSLWRDAVAVTGTRRHCFQQDVGRNNGILQFCIYSQRSTDRNAFGIHIVTKLSYAS
jgi:hypothetical protein